MDATQGQGEALPKTVFQTTSNPGEAGDFAANNQVSAGQPELSQPATGSAPTSHTNAALGSSSAQSVPWAEVLLALALLVMGFFFWEWHLIAHDNSGIGQTLFLLSCIGVTLVFMHFKGIRQNRKSLVALAVSVAASLPFLIYGTRGFNPLIWLFAVCSCLVWVAYSCRSIIAPKLSGFIAADLFNQLFIVPWANCGSFFTSFFKIHPRNGQKHFAVLAIIGASLLAFLPLGFVICNLLAASDDGFANLLTTIGSAFENIGITTLAGWILNFFLAIPLAMYIFGSVEGNTAGRHVGYLKYDVLERLFVRLHGLKSLAFIMPLVLLIIIYLSYFIAMGSYLTSGLAGQLPITYTYAEYARQGFFELCGVAAINLLVMGVVYLFAKRLPRTYPLVLRILTAIIALLTIALVITAASKMLLYIATYGLSPLRLYTSVFMLLLLVVFFLLLAWHVKPFNVARPCIAAALGLFLVLSLANTDGLIANYNVQHYLSGRTERIDPEMLGHMSSAALPALRELEANASDPEVRTRTEWALHRNVENEFLAPELQPHWYNWNVMDWLTREE